MFSHAYWSTALEGGYLESEAEDGGFIDSAASTHRFRFLLPSDIR